MLHDVSVRALTTAVAAALTTVDADSRQVISVLRRLTLDASHR